MNNPIRTIWLGACVLFAVTGLTISCGEPDGSEPESVKDEDRKPPSVSIESPEDGAKISGTTTLRVEASDNTRVDKVRLFINNKQLQSLQQPPWKWDWDTEFVHPGSYQLSAKAVDPAGNTSSDNIDIAVESNCDDESNCSTNPDPSVDSQLQFISPMKDTAVCATVPVAVMMDPYRPQLDAVQFKVGDKKIGEVENKPYRIDWDTADQHTGPRTLKAKAVGIPDLSTSRKVTLKDSSSKCDNPPSLFVVTPRNGSRHGGKIEVVAKALDDDKVRDVRFFIDGRRMLTDTDPPYRFIWDSNLFADGPYQLEVVATDSEGQKTKKQLGVTVDRSSLITEISKPVRGKLYQRVLPVEIATSTKIQVVKIDLFITKQASAQSEKKNQKTLEGSPWKTELDVSELESGKHVLNAVAHPEKGQSERTTKSFKIDRPPAVEFVSPKAGETYKEGVDIEISARDDLGLAQTVVRVGDRVLSKLKPGETFEWNPGPKYQGQQKLKATVKDTSGNTDKAEIQVKFECERTWYPDRDGDGFGDPNNSETIPTCKESPPSHLLDNSGDCDDNAPSTYPGAAHRDSTEACMQDKDNDGFGNDSPPEGVEPGSDCDDTDPNKYNTWRVYEDNDGDGWGKGESLDLCGGADIPSGTSSKTGDCNDKIPGAYPGAAPKDDESKCMKDSDKDEYGDAKPPAGVEPGSDCNDSDPNKFKTWQLYRDRDRDGWGIGSKKPVCSGNNFPKDWSLQKGDCGDGNRNIHPGAAQKDSKHKCMKDEDGDGYGAPSPPDGVRAGTDCNDTNPRLYKTYRAYKDFDKDGWGVGSKQDVCGGESLPPGWSENKGDCSDNDDTIFPGAAPEDDNDKCMKDSDHDDYGDARPPAGVEPGSDCDDSGRHTYPGAAPRDHLAKCMKDADKDDYGAQDPPEGVAAGSDCNDSSQNAFPGAAENDSQSECMEDKDGDGYGASTTRPSVTDGSDCDDSNDEIKPGAFDSCDGADNNCSGVVDEGCSCEYKNLTRGVCSEGQIDSDTGDCNPPQSYESPESSVDGLDNDCDGQVDESQ